MSDICTAGALPTWDHQGPYRFGARASATLGPEVSVALVQTLLPLWDQQGCHA